MTPTTADPAGSVELTALAESVLEDHAELGRTVARLRELCATLGEGRLPLHPEAAELIQSFESQLITHFDAEDAEDVFGGLVAKQPRLLTRVERLQAEHREIAEKLRELLEFARRARSAMDLKVQIESFLDRFDLHERAENELMHELLLLDEGGGG